MSLKKPSEEQIANIVANNKLEEATWHGKFGVVGIHRYVFTYGILAQCHELGYEMRWCFEHKLDAVVALKDWVSGKTVEPEGYTRKLPEERINNFIYGNSPGKYDHLCTQAREQSEAEGCLLIVLNGNKGSGFSAQLPQEGLKDIPQQLRQVADQIEKSTM